MNRIPELQKLMTIPQMLVSDPISIDYLIGDLYDPGERFLALLVFKDEQPHLFVNALFPASKTVATHTYQDAMNPIDLLKEHLLPTDLGIDGSLASRFTLQLLKGPYTLHDTSALVESMRAIKSVTEIAIMEEASHYNDAVMAKVKAYIKPGITEQGLAQKIIEWQSEAPLSGISFTPIVLFSDHAADPHGHPSDRILTENDSVLVDMGGIYQGYCSDMTRCFWLGNPEKFKEIYDLVLKANQAAIAAVKPGIPLKAIDKVARDIITTAGYGEYFTHRLGHGIGREVHETLDVSSANETLIQEGMCFSIEPGIYIPHVVGVRIEDLVTVTATGVTVLNRFSKDIADNYLTKTQDF